MARGVKRSRNTFPVDDASDTFRKKHTSAGGERSRCLKENTLKIKNKTLKNSINTQRKKLGVLCSAVFSASVVHRGKTTTNRLHDHLHDRRHSFLSPSSSSLPLFASPSSPVLPVLTATFQPHSTPDTSPCRCSSSMRRIAAPFPAPRTNLGPQHPRRTPPEERPQKNAASQERNLCTKKAVP